jgi:hypothetical protein
MAGPINLDNYEIEADESSDELLIRHVPTDKTTTLSEDTFEALTVEELSLTGSTPVTGGPYGDGDDWMPVSSFKPTQGSISTTSTTYEAATTNYQSSFVPVNDLQKPTNVVDVGLSFGGYLKGDTAGETAFARLKYDFSSLPTTEISGPHSGKFLSSPIGSIGGANPRKIEFEMRTSAGTASMESNVSTYLWLKLQ